MMGLPPRVPVGGDSGILVVSIIEGSCVEL